MQPATLFGFLSPTATRIQVGSLNGSAPSPPGHCCETDPRMAVRQLSGATPMLRSLRRKDVAHGTARPFIRWVFLEAICGVLNDKLQVVLSGNVG